MAVVLPTVERRLAAVVEAVPARVVGAADLAEPVAAEVDVREPRVEVLVPAAAVADLRARPVVPVAVLLSADPPGLAMMVLVLLAAVEVNADFLSSSLAPTLGRLRCVDEVEVAVVGRRVVGVVDDIGGRVGGLLRPPLGRAPVVGPVDVRDEADVAVPVTPALRAVAVVLANPVRLVAGEMEPALA